MTLVENTNLLKDSALFDREWYVSTYPDVIASSLEPEEHYLIFGERMGRRPSKSFEPRRYQQLYCLEDIPLGSVLLHCLANNHHEFRALLQTGGNSPEYKDSIFVKYTDVAHLNAADSAKLAQSLDDHCLEYDSLPMVSVIMPTWNRADIIHEAIESVMEQAYDNWELLIIDDDSQDGTDNVVNGFKDFRIKYYKISKGNGAIARNHGLRLASGDIVAFLDSDNIWSPTYLNHVVRSHLDSGKYVVYTGFIDAVVESKKIESYTYKFRSFDFQALSNRNFIDLNTFSFDAKLLDIFGVFDPSLPRQQDWDLVTRFTAFFEPYGIDKPLVFYRRNAEWNQVTITQKHVDTRSVVMQKNSALTRNYEPRRSWGLRHSFNTTFARKRKILVAIKISAPNEEIGKGWGDYYFAHQLGQALNKYGWQYVVHCQDQWYGTRADVNIVLRGRHRFDVKRTYAKHNLLWIISHPDRLAKGELNDFDHVFVASEIFVEKVRRVTSTPASVLHQATDNKVFYHSVSQIEGLSDSAVFIGNSRNQYRLFVDWAIQENIPLQVWGREWENFLTNTHWKGGFIENSMLSSYYASAGVLLNDHWDGMRENGFISNRLFDASAAGAFIISDNVKGLDKVFYDNIVTAANSKDLKAKVDYYLLNPDLRRLKAKKAQEIVLKYHTFDKRAEEINNKITEISAEFYLVSRSNANASEMNI